jgi:hypothetical protein
MLKEAFQANVGEPLKYCFILTVRVLEHIHVFVCVCKWKNSFYLFEFCLPQLVQRKINENL